MALFSTQLQDDVHILRIMGASNYASLLRVVEVCIPYLQATNTTAQNPDATVTNFTACRFLTAFLHVWAVARNLLMTPFWTDDQLENYVVSLGLGNGVLLKDYMITAEQTHGQEIVSDALTAYAAMRNTRV
ncbi:MAG: hypothetical protein WB421_13870 [Terriglobales bacterium]